MMALITTLSVVSSLMLWMGYNAFFVPDNHLPAAVANGRSLDDLSDAPSVLSRDSKYGVVSTHVVHNSEIKSESSKENLHSKYNKIAIVNLLANQVNDFSKNGTPETREIVNATKDYGNPGLDKVSNGNVKQNYLDEDPHSDLDENEETAFDDHHTLEKDQYEILDKFTTTQLTGNKSPDLESTINKYFNALYILYSLVTYVLNLDSQDTKKLSENVDELKIIAKNEMSDHVEMEKPFSWESYAVMVISVIITLLVMSLLILFGRSYCNWRRKNKHNKHLKSIKPLKTVADPLI